MKMVSIFNACLPMSYATKPINILCCSPLQMISKCSNQMTQHWHQLAPASKATCANTPADFHVMYSVLPPHMA